MNKIDNEESKNGFDVMDILQGISHHGIPMYRLLVDRRSAMVAQIDFLRNEGKLRSARS